MENESSRALAQAGQGPGVPCGARAHQDLAQGYFSFQRSQSGYGHWASPFCFCGL